MISFPNSDIIICWLKIFFLLRSTGSQFPAGLRSKKISSHSSWSPQKNSSC